MRILITGNPGVGKSRLLREVVEESGRRVAGILTPEIRAGGKREGFRIVDLASGETEVMAAPGIGGPKVSRYGVDVAAIDRTVDRFWRSFPEADLIALDEIGPMEFFSDRFREVVDRVLASPKDVLAVVHRKYEARFREVLEPHLLGAGNYSRLKEDLLARLPAGSRVQGSLGKGTGARER